MFKLEIHKCDQNPVEVYVHKFKTEIKQKMMDDFCTKYATTYNSTKKKFLDSIPDPEFRELVCFELPSIVSVFVNICYCLTFQYNVYPFIWYESWDSFIIILDNSKPSPMSNSISERML